MYQARLPPRRRVHGIATWLGWLLALLLPVAAVVVLVVVLSGGNSRRAQRPTLVESVFQDDDHLLYASTATVTRTLQVLRQLGVDRLRLTILWRAIAPDPQAATPPSGFDGSDPAAYPAASWAPYDRIVRMATADGIGVMFNLTAPGPLWAMTAPAPSGHYADHYGPSPAAFGQFVTAVGRRYSGSYAAAATGAGAGATGAGAGATGTAAAGGRLPRVSFWTIWNEPNQPGWLAPQRQPFNGRQVPAAPALYRSLADAAFTALRRTGHGPDRDTVLIGELAPEGSETAAGESPLPAMTFLRALYCVDDAYRPLRGEAAVAVGCPLLGGPAAFRRAHPALFDATGFGHHPYSFFLAPPASLPDPNFAPLSDLGRLEKGLDGSLAAYGVHRRLPLYLTEYGYETNPPDPYRGVPERLQSLYLNEAQYIASRDPRVKAFAQFLLYDALPNPRYPKGSIGYWSTFQTGLMFADGRPKLSLNSYRLPIFVPNPSVAPGARMTVWAMLRPAPNRTRQSAEIQWRPLAGAYRRLARVTTSDPSGFLTAAVTLPGAGAVRIAWISPEGTVWHSRAVGVR